MNKEDVKHIAHLARLSFTEAESEGFLDRLNSVLGYVEQLKEVDTEGTPPLAQPTPLENVWRQDETRPTLVHAQTFLNTQHEEDGCFEVPAVLGEAEE